MANDVYHFFERLKQKFDRSIRTPVIVVARHEVFVDRARKARNLPPQRPAEAPQKKHAYRKTGPCTVLAAIPDTVNIDEDVVENMVCISRITSAPTVKVGTTHAAVHATTPAVGGTDGTLAVGRDAVTCGTSKSGVHHRTSRDVSGKDDTLAVGHDAVRGGTTS